MSDDNGAPFTASIKSGTDYDAALIAIRANSAQELSNRLRELGQSAALGDLAALDGLFKGAFGARSAVAGGVAQTPPATPPVTTTATANDSWQGMSQTPSSDDPWAAPQTQAQPPAQAQPGGIETVNDRYGNVYTLNIPTAPMCPHGPMAQADKAKRDGTGRYKQWVCAVPVRSGFKQKTTCESQWVN